MLLALASPRAADAGVPLIRLDQLTGETPLAALAERVDADPGIAIPLRPKEVTFRFRLSGSQHERRWAIVGSETMTERMTLRFDAAGRHYELGAGTVVGNGQFAVTARPVSIVIPEAAWDAGTIALDVRYGAARGLPRLAPVDDIIPEGVTRSTIYVAFAGFFVAIALFNGILFLRLRDAPFGWYALALLATSSILSLDSGIVYFSRTPLEIALLISLLLWCQFAAQVQFSRSFLGTKRLAPRFDRILIVVLILNGFAIVGERIYDALWPLFGLDEVLEFSVLGMQIAAGVLALRAGVASARFYLAAFGITALGIIINDLNFHGIIFPRALWVSLALEATIAIASLLLALALADRQQRVDDERRRLRVLVDVDELTGIANRRSFDRHLGLAFARAVRSQSRVGLLMIDVDEFKKYNDSQGHVAGDEALRRVAAVLRSVAQRPDDVVARYGGEEFAMIVSIADPDDVRKIGERARAAVEALDVPHPAARLGKLTVSIGVASIHPGPLDLPGALVESADEALYAAKHAGRNRVVAERGPGELSSRT